jgi:hypothetical protein
MQDGRFVTKLEFEAILATKKWMVTNTSNPVDMDNFVETVRGCNLNDLFPCRKSMQVLKMKFADHSKCLPSSP